MQQLAGAFAKSAAGETHPSHAQRDGAWRMLQICVSKKQRRFCVSLQNLDYDPPPYPHAASCSRGVVALLPGTLRRTPSPPPMRDSSARTPRAAAPPPPPPPPPPRHPGSVGASAGSANPAPPPPPPPNTMDSGGDDGVDADDPMGDEADACGGPADAEEACRAALRGEDPLPCPPPPPRAACSNAGSRSQWCGGGGRGCAPPPPDTAAAGKAGAGGGAASGAPLTFVLAEPSRCDVAPLPPTPQHPTRPSPAPPPAAGAGYGVEGTSEEGARVRFAEPLSAQASSFFRLRRRAAKSASSKQQRSRAKPPAAAPAATAGVEDAEEGAGEERGCDGTGDAEPVTGEGGPSPDGGVCLSREVPFATGLASEAADGGGERGRGGGASGVAAAPPTPGTRNIPPPVPSQGSTIRAPGATPAARRKATKVGDAKPPGQNSSRPTVYDEVPPAAVAPAGVRGGNRTERVAVAPMGRATATGGTAPTDDAAAAAPSAPGVTVARVATTADAPAASPEGVAENVRFA